VVKPLNSLDSIAELVRKRALDKVSNKLDKSDSNKLYQASQKHAIVKLQTAEGVRLKIIAAINNIDIHDVKREQKSITIFVENVLLWQFGEELMTDPSFINLVDDVTDIFLNEPALVDQLNKLVGT